MRDRDRQDSRDDSSPMAIRQRLIDNLRKLGALYDDFEEALKKTTFASWASGQAFSSEYGVIAGQIRRDARILVLHLKANGSAEVGSQLADHFAEVENAFQRWNQCLADLAKLALQPHTEKQWNDQGLETLWALMGLSGIANELADVLGTISPDQLSGAMKSRSSEDSQSTGNQRPAKAGADQKGPIPLADQDGEWIGPYSKRELAKALNPALTSPQAENLKKWIPPAEWKTRIKPVGKRNTPCRYRIDGLEQWQIEALRLADRQLQKEKRSKTTG